MGNVTFHNSGCLQGFVEIYGRNFDEDTEHLTITAVFELNLKV